LPLYDPAINIDIGTSEIKHRFTKTGDDPILVSAAFNAGGLYKSSKNDWHLRSHGNHLDRAAAWYGDACTVIAELQA
jgi:peptidoglycan L-alanyl-D-glutamate endopeptidase CwlK